MGLSRHAPARLFQGFPRGRIAPDRQPNTGTSPWYHFDSVSLPYSIVTRLLEYGEYRNVTTRRASRTMCSPVCGTAPLSVFLLHGPFSEARDHDVLARYECVFDYAESFSTISVASPFIKPQSSPICSQIGFGRRHNTLRKSTTIGNNGTKPRHRKPARA